MRIVGQLILVEGTGENSIEELEQAVEEGILAYNRRIPGVEELIVYMHGKTKERWDCNGVIRGLEAYQDDDIPAGYVWIINAEDKLSFSPKKIN